MPRCYTVTLAPTAIAVATTDLAELGAADDIPIGIRAIRVFQLSDFGDAQDEVVRIAVVRGNTTSGSGGNAGVAAVRKNPKDAAASFTAETANTTPASAGTAENVYTNGFNVRAGLDVIIPESDMPRTDQGTGFLCVRFTAAPVDSLTVGIELDVWEYP